MTTADPLNDRVERTIGADVRLLYGLGVPMLAATGFIIAYALSGSWVLLALVVLFVFLAAGVVIVGMLQMLRDGDTPDATPADDPRR